MPHKFDPDNWKRLESPERRAVLPPETILDLIGLSRGQTFVDVGAGTGYFAIPAAEKVGPHGKVYAVDVAPRMLSLMADRTKEAGLPIEFVLSKETAIPLDDAVADHVFTSTVLHEVPGAQRVTFLRELARLLKPDGLMTILDWAPVDEVTMGPPAHIRILRSEVEDLLRQAHVAVSSNESFGDHFYIVQGHVTHP